MLYGDLNIGGAPPGDYLLEIIVRDKVSRQVAKVTLPFTIDE